MSLIDSIRNFLGVNTVNIGDLNKEVTYRQPQRKPEPQKKALEEIEVTPEYKRVLELLDAGCPIVFVTGTAGTGKSTLIQYLRAVTTKNIVVVAPTGVAALNAKGVTIHSFFRFPPRIINDDDIKRIKDRKLYTKLDILMIDEISMVRADLMDAIDKFLRTNSRDSNRPFSGVQLLLIGDLYQLPPVVTRKEESVLFARKYTSPYFFSAKSLEQCQLAPIELIKVYRQEEEHFIELLDSLRVSENVNSVITEINETCYHQDVSRNSVLTLTCTNAAADAINICELDRLPGEEHVYKGEIHGKFSLQEDKLPSPMNLVLKKDAQVMFTKNDEQKRWVNGTLGIVRAIKGGSIQVELATEHPGIIHDVQRVTWESFKYEYDYASDKIIPVVIGRYTQFPLMLAWAVTIHKSQGKTLENVRIDLGHGAFAPGQVYVALSRCRSLQDITLARPINPGDVRSDERIKRFYAIFDQMRKKSTLSP